MRLGELAPGELAARLRSPGLRLRTGPFVTQVHSRLEDVAVGLAAAYPEHTLADAGDFVDFVVGVARPRGWRRWLRSQVEFAFDGEPLFNPLPGDQGFALLEWGLNWCVSAHGLQYVTLHGAVLERHGRALLLPAPSGSGKSTLCAALAFHGWRLLSDELTLIQPTSAQVVPLPRPISLKNASIEVIRSWAPQAAFSRVVRDTTKGDVAHCRPPVDAVAREQETADPAWIVLPRYAAGASAQLTPLPKARALMQLIESTFAFNVQRRRGFDALVRLVDRCDCFEFNYGRLDDAVPLLEAMADVAVE
jgi:HprK-related kinase A